MHCEKQLVKNGLLVNFDVLKTRVDACPGSDGEAVCRVDLWLGEEDDDGEGEERTNDVEWGAFGFIYLVALLSFLDAKPRGFSAQEFVADDGFRVEDLMECLCYEGGRLEFYADYVRGRCLKTRITVNPDGRTTIETVNRGNALSRWLDRMKGKESIRVVSAQLL